MFTTLLNIKLSLAINPADTAHDTILVNALAAVGARFDHECNRTLARTVNATFEFDATEPEIIVPCYPIETISCLELKTTESSGSSNPASSNSASKPIGPAAPITNNSPSSISFPQSFPSRAHIPASVCERRVNN